MRITRRCLWSVLVVAIACGVAFPRGATAGPVAVTPGGPGTPVVNPGPGTPVVNPGPATPTPNFLTPVVNPGPETPVAVTPVGPGTPVVHPGPETPVPVFVCADTFPACDGTCPPDMKCVTTATNCTCLAIGCCLTASGLCDDDVVEFQCDQLQGQFVPGAICAGTGCQTPTPSSTPTNTGTATSTGTATHTGTVTRTPTVTPTKTKVPNGGGCDDPADCISGNCVDDTCCMDRTCPPGESCDNPGNVGMCSPDPTSAAPALSDTGVWLAVALLIAIAGVAFPRRRSTN